MKMSAAEL